MTESIINQLDESVRQSKEVRDFGAAIWRLEKSKDFQEVVLTGYLEKEAIRLVQARTDVNMQSPQAQADILRQIDAIGCFKDFLRTRLMLAENASGAIEQAEEMREALRAEDL